MRATRSGIVIGLVLALLVPGGVVGQGASPLAELSAAPSAEPTSVPSAQPMKRPSDALRPGIVVLVDGAEDLRDATTGERVDGPGYANMRVLTLALDEDNLSVTYEMQDNVSEPSEPSTTTLSYNIRVDIDSDGSADFDVAYVWDGGWHAELVDLASGSTTPLDVPVIKGSELKATVPLVYLGWPKEMRFRGDVQVTATPDPVGDPLTVVTWEDRVPQAVDEFMPTVRLGDGRKAAKYYKQLIGAKVDSNADFGRVRSIIDGLYKNGATARRLDDLGSGSVHLNAKAKIATGTRQCASSDFVDNIYGPCTSAVQSLITFASEYPTDSKDRRDAKIAAAFLEAAKEMRSAAINEGVPVTAMDKALRHSVEQLRSSCAKDNSPYVYCSSGSR